MRTTGYPVYTPGPHKFGSRVGRARLQPQRGMPSTAGTACLRSDAGGALR